MTRRYEFTGKDGVRYTAEMEIDTDWLFRQLASRAMQSKHRKATSLNGAVKVKVAPK
jgi:hypothetical protein